MEPHFAAPQSADLLDWHPFHTSHWPRSISGPEELAAAPLAREGPQAARLRLSWDLGSHVTEQQKKATIKAWCAELPKMQELRWLSVWSHATPPLFEALCQLPGLECLQIKWSNLKSLDGIENLRNLKYLWIGSSTRVASIEPLAQLENLEFLSIENFKLIDDFTPLTRLTKLHTLEVAGSMWTRQKVGTLEPFAQMHWLKSLAVDTAGLDSLAPLARLKNLRRLGLPGSMPMPEYAGLAAQLPQTECRWFAPWIDLADSGIGKCDKCGQLSKIMLTGKGGGVLCRHCDAPKVKKREAAYEAAYQAAKRAGA
jgi:hypothetical protein